PDAVVTDKAMELLCRYAWPGNVRELENELERALLMARGGSIARMHLSAKLRGEALRLSTKGTLAQRMRELEREVIREALAECEGNGTRTAERLGIARTHLLKKMGALGLTDPKEAPAARRERERA